MDQAAKALHLLTTTSTPLAEVAEQLGYPNYRAFGAWCRRKFARGPREIRENQPARLGRGPSPNPASMTWQVRCTPDEREAIVSGVATLAEAWGESHGAVVARAVGAASKKIRK